MSWLFSRPWLPTCDQEAMMDDNQGDLWQALKNLRKSATDKKIAGVCGGFGEHTPVPAWLWRALFLVTAFLYGTGLVVYVILWICMPAPNEPS